MANTTYAAPVGPFNNVDGTAVNTFTSFADISNVLNAKIGANVLGLGSEIEVIGQGEFSNTGTPTLGLGVFFGTAAVSLGTGTPITTTTGAASWPWFVKYHGRVRAIGTGGSIVGQGFWKIGTALTVFTLDQALPATAAARTVTIDTTVEKPVGIGAVWGTSSASNTIKTTLLSVRLIN